MTSLRLAGLLTQGEEVCHCDDLVLLPADLIDAGDVVYRLAESVAAFDLAAGDFLVAEPRARGNAATGEWSSLQCTSVPSSAAGGPSVGVAR